MGQVTIPNEIGRWVLELEAQNRLKNQIIVNQDSAIYWFKESIERNDSLLRIKNAQLDVWKLKLSTCTSTTDVYLQDLDYQRKLHKKQLKKVKNQRNIGVGAAILILLLSVIK